ncbi:hypothetical protein BJ742DRAFT_302936 [Cladochytrium replicatum]|nr:hypothetical protein BJ742DRAFT_302936 [Cladochytrium replicatum]
MRNSLDVHRLACNSQRRGGSSSSSSLLLSVSGVVLGEVGAQRLVEQIFVIGVGVQMVVIVVGIAGIDARVARLDCPVSVQHFIRGTVHLSGTWLESKKIVTLFLGKYWETNSSRAFNCRVYIRWDECTNRLILKSPDLAIDAHSTAHVRRPASSLFCHYLFVRVTLLCSAACHQASRVPFATLCYF